MLRIKYAVALGLCFGTFFDPAYASSEEWCRQNCSLKLQRASFTFLDKNQVYLSTNGSDGFTLTDVQINWTRTFSQNESEFLQVKLTRLVPKLDDPMESIAYINLCNISDDNTRNGTVWRNIGEHLLAKIFANTSQCPVLKGTTDVFPYEVELSEVTRFAKHIQWREPIVVNIALKHDFVDVTALNPHEFNLAFAVYIGRFIDPFDSKSASPFTTL